MWRHPIGLAVLSTFLAASAAAPQQPVVRTADPVKRGLKVSDFPRTIKVADNVYTYEDFHAGPEKFTTTNLFVVTDEGVLVADGQGSVAETTGLVAAIGKVTTRPIKYVVICSDHGDHTAGNEAFPASVTYIIHPTAKATLDRSPNSWKPPAGAALVADERSLTLGGEPIEVLFLGRAHTGGDLAVSLPRRKILFLSEIYLNRVFPAMRSAYPDEWVKTLDRADAIKPDLYIAGHGFTEEARVSREEFQAYRKALAAVIAEATRLHRAGVPVDDAVKQANWGEYASWTLASSQGPIALRKVYEELDGTLQ
jgi:cyclase